LILKGKKWFGTKGGGLLSFDGSEWKTYKSTSSGLTNDTIVKITVDENNNKWIATPNGVSVFDDNKWVTYNTRNSKLIDNKVLSIVITSNGNKYFLAKNGFSKFDGNSWTTYNITDDVIDLAVDSKENIWLILCSETYSFKRCLVCFDGNNSTYYNEDNSDINTDIIYSVTIDENDNKWLGTDKGIWVFSGSSTSLYDIRNEQIEYSLYPNPTQDVLCLSLNSPVDAHSKVSIFNINGEVLISKIITDQNTILDLSKIPSGVYLCQIYYNGKSLTTSKIIKR